MAIISSEDMIRKSEAFCNSDGSFLIVPQQGSLYIHTEMGNLKVEPHEIIVIPKNIVFSINGSDDENVSLKGYVLEVKEGHFELPDLGPIGSNGLANPHHFQYPVSCMFDNDSEHEWNIVTKAADAFWSRSQNHSPYNVAAWRGNYAPYKYDLRKFCPLNTVSFDHADPSIFTVLTVKKTPYDQTPLVDFVVFPPRWNATENTFRPPYYHKNCMSEFMGLISGEYEAKKTGFLPGGASLHNAGVAHGPDKETYEKAVCAELKPEKLDNGYAFHV